MSLRAVSALLEALEHVAALLEAAASRLADWAHGRCCDTCRHEQGVMGDRRFSPARGARGTGALAGPHDR